MDVSAATTDQAGQDLSWRSVFAILGLLSAVGMVVGFIALVTGSVSGWFSIVTVVMVFLVLVILLSLGLSILVVSKPSRKLRFDRIQLLLITITLVLVFAYARILEVSGGDYWHQHWWISGGILLGLCLNFLASIALSRLEKNLD